MQRLLPEPSGLAYAPLFFLLPSLPGGDGLVQDARVACTAAMSRALNTLVRRASTTAEKRMLDWVEDLSLSGAPPLAARACLYARHLLPSVPVRRVEVHGGPIDCSGRTLVTALSTHSPQGKCALLSRDAVRWFFAFRSFSLPCTMCEAEHSLTLLGERLVS